MSLGQHSVTRCAHKSRRHHCRGLCTYCYNTLRYYYRNNKDVFELMYPMIRKPGYESKSYQHWVDLKELGLSDEEICQKRNIQPASLKRMKKRWSDRGLNIKIEAMY